VDPKNPDMPIFGFAVALNPHIPESKLRLLHDFIKFIIKDPKTWYDKASYPYPSRNFLELPGIDEARRTRYLDVFIKDISNGRYVQRSPKILELNEAIHRAMERVVLKGEDCKKSLDQACGEMDAALAQP
jgi:hypothetical protein